ncbi:putative WD repeat-containing protein, partial [Naja naja]
MKILLESGISV